VLLLYSVALAHPAITPKGSNTAAAKARAPAHRFRSSRWWSLAAVGAVLTADPDG